MTMMSEGRRSRSKKVRRRWRGEASALGQFDRLGFDMLRIDRVLMTFLISLASGVANFWSNAPEDDRTRSGSEVSRRALPLRVLYLRHPGIYKASTLPNQQAL